MKKASIWKPYIYLGENITVMVEMGSYRISSG